MITLLIQIITPRIEIENGVRRWKDEATHETVYLQTYKQVIKKFRTNPVILSSIKSKTHIDRDLNWKYYRIRLRSSICGSFP